MSEKENEDVYKRNGTKYGEFVCSEHKWLPLDKQKENAKILAEITNKRKNDEK